MTRVRRGQILVLFALGAVALMSLVALAIDSSRVYMSRRQAQNAADAAALAMAWELIRTRGDCAAAVAKGLQVAADMGYTNDANTTVEMYCPPADGEYKGQTGYVQARITTGTDTTFLRVVGTDRLRSTVEAVARARMGTLFGSNAVVALSETGSGGKRGGIKLNGNSYVHIKNGGFFSNSNDARRSFWAVGNADIVLSPGQRINTVGGCDVPARYQDLCNPGVPQVDYDQWLAQLDRIVPPIPDPPACTFTYSRLRKTGGTLGQPGKTVVYCVTGNVDLTDVKLVGRVVIRAQGDVDFDGLITAENLEIYMERARGDVTFNAGTDFSAQRLRIYAYYDADVNLLGNTQVASQDALLYLTSGLLDQRGNSTIKFCPPPPDDPDGFGGLTIFMKEYSGNPDYIVKGNTENWIAGTVLAPRATIQFNGNTENVYASVQCHGITAQGIPTQIIGYSVKFNGNSWTYIDFVPQLLFGRTTIELLK